MRKAETMMPKKIITLMIIFSSVLLNSMDVVASGNTLIFPIPKQIQITSDIFIPDETMTIIVPQNMSRNDIFLARFLVRELSDKFGIAVKIEPGMEIPKNRKIVVIGRYDNPLIQGYCKENKLEVNDKIPGPEGYILQVSPDKIIVAGSDEKGAFYGLQSLRQLLDAGNGKEIQGVNVKDWPSYPFRAIRLYVPGPENLAFFRRFMRDFMALYKYNKVIIEFNCMRLDKHPEANAGWIEFSKYMQYTRSNSTEGIRGEEKNSSHFDSGDGNIIEKNDVRDIVDFASENFLEVIPEIPSLTHGYYLLTRHPELAEYPGDRWPDTYCPSNPKSYELMFDVYDEYIDVIKPKMINIGHDEWWGAPLGVCPLCKGKDPSELFARDINKIYTYLSGKGIKVAMWGDYLLESVRSKGPQQRTSSTGVKYETPGAVRPSVVKDSIPKEILILNWFWDEDQDKEMELQKFGFKQIYGNFMPDIHDWDERVKKIDLQGGAPSSWAATNEFNFGKDVILNFLGCANIIWSGHTIDQSDLLSVVSGLMPSVRSALSGKRIPGKEGNAQEPVNISSKFNLSKESKVFNFNLSSFKNGEVKSQGSIFNLSTSAKEPANCAIAVGSAGTEKNPLPSEIRGIPVNEDVSSLIFLQACAVPSKNHKAYFNIPDFFDSADLLGWYEIVYDDGFKAIVPVQYGVNILEWNPGVENRLEEGEWAGSSQNIYCYEADPVSCTSDIKGDPITFFAFEWVNPRFGKIIREVNLHGTINYQSLRPVHKKPVTEPMKNNAILLAAITKVKKREVFQPGK